MRRVVCRCNAGMVCALISALDQPRLAQATFKVLYLLHISPVKAAAGIVPMLARAQGFLRQSGLLCPRVMEDPLTTGHKMDVELGKHRPHHLACSEACMPSHLEPSLHPVTCCIMVIWWHRLPPKTCAKSFGFWLSPFHISFSSELYCTVLCSLAAQLVNSANM